MKITADTITDEQLRELRDASVANGTFDVARVALGDACIPFENPEFSGYRRPSLHEQNIARARCAEILNERSKSDQRRS